MMIWFAGILLNTCCHNDNKIKTKNTELWVWCLLTQLRALSDILKVSRQCVLLTNFSFQVLVLRNHIFFRFLDSTATFFYTESKHGAPSQDLTRLFFLLFPFFWMRSWRNAWLGSRKRCAEFLWERNQSSYVDILISVNC